MLDDKSFYKRQAILGLRGSFGSVLERYVASVQTDWRVVTADTATSAGLSRLVAKHPHRIIECGIAEQTAVNVATSLSLEGYEVFVGSFAPFIVGRAWEQLRLAAYMEANFTLFGFGAGSDLAYLGFTHCSLEDTALMSSLPNVSIYEPASPLELSIALNAQQSSSGIKYIRLTGEGAVDQSFLDTDQLGETGMRLYRRGGRGLIICSGSLTKDVLGHSDFEASGIDILVLNKVHPVDEHVKDILDEYRGCPIYAIQDSYVNSIRNSILEDFNLSCRKISPSLLFSKPGSKDYVRDKLDFTFEKIKF